MIRTLVCSALIAFSVSPVALADSSASPPVSAIVLLRSHSSNVCGTGVVIGTSRILVSAHVATRICNRSICPNLQVARARKLNALAAEKLSLGEIKVSTLSETLDVALLSTEKEIEVSRQLPLSTSTPQTKESIQVIGFPDCELLTITDGYIQGLDNFYLRLSAAGRDGNSGSPVINTEGELAGFVDEAQELRDKLWSSISGASFKLRAVRTSVVSGFLESVPDRRPHYLAQELIKLHSSSVASSRGLTRALRGVRYDRAVRDLRLDVLREASAPDTVEAFSLLGMYPGEMLRAQLTAPLSPMHRVVALANRERLGLRSSPLEHIDPDQIPASHVLAPIFQASAKDTYGGWEYYLTKLAVLYSPVVLILFAAWSLSLGYVLAAESGNLVTRLGKALLVGVAIWPLSLLVWILLRTRPS